MKKRLNDLRRFAPGTPLDLTREKTKPAGHILELSRSHKSRAIAFDLHHAAPHDDEPRSTPEIYVVESPRASPWPRVALVGLTLLLVLAVTFAGVFGEGKRRAAEVLAGATAGVSNLQNAGSAFAAGDFVGASTNFATALDSFQKAESDIHILAGAGTVLATKPESVQAGSRLVSAGRLIASAGTKFAAAADRLKLTLATYDDRAALFAAGQPTTSVADELSALAADALAGSAELRSAETLLADITPTALPTDLATRVISAQTKLRSALTLAEPYLAVLPHVADLLGSRVPRRYLILFQNPDEIRPTGGFIGSVGLLTLADGFIKSFDIKDVYEFDGQIARVIPPPDGYQLITDRWGLRDANTSPNFPTSAAQAAALFEEGGGGSVDGVFAITSDLLTRLVGATDGVTVPRFGHVAAGDLNLLLSLVIETKLDGAAAPKAILSDVAKELRSKLLALPKEQLFTLVRAAVAAKEIQAWFPRASFDGVAAAFGIDGALPMTDGDYLAITDTSLSGNKSDRYTRNVVTHATALADGGAIDTLTLTRVHAFTDADGERIRTLAKRYDIALDQKILDLLGAGRNIDYLKIFVPAGSELLSVTGISRDRVEMKTENDRTYFVTSLTVPAGESRTLTLTYRLPANVNARQFTTIYQAGTHPTDFTKSITENKKEVLHERASLAAGKTWDIQ